MGDSDDEYDRKRRDKFRGERSGDRTSTSDRGDRGWNDRFRPRPRGDYYGRSRYSPPPMKRMRPDFEDRGHRGGGGGFGMHDYGGMYGGYGDPYGGLAAPFGAVPAQRELPPPASDGMTQPAMMTLKQFLATQDDSIPDDVAITKYSEYKLEFKRNQLNEFFVAHKDEEWFKLKYHPELSTTRKEEQVDYLKRRVEVFDELLVKGEIEKVSVDTTNTEPLTRLLDTVVIKLEGGTDDDLAVLDIKPTIAPPPLVVAKPIEPKKADAVEKNGTEEAEDAPAPAEKRENKKRRRTHSDSSSSSSDSESDTDETKKTPTNGDESAANDAEEDKKDESEEAKPAEKEKATDDDDDVAMKEPEVAAEDGNADEKEKQEEKNEDDVVVVLEEDSTPVKKLEELHRTSSIFVRNLAPTITKSEVEALCKKYDGFLRVAIADPAVERRWFRRGWITFKRDVNIKEICWNLNSIRLRDCELAPIVNRDLSRRVRPVNGVTNHKTVCKSDIKLCARIAHSLDEKYNLWKDAEKVEEQKTFGLQSNNPVLKNITDYLIEEADAEEEELLGLAGGKEESEGEVLDRDPDIITVLDKIVLYLRIVHSFDFYNHCEYPYEDEMPNRCGIVHARGPPPAKVTSSDIQDYIKNFETKMKQYLSAANELSEDELKNLGAKEIESEVEKFITANTQELAKDKWLCPLSGKKFKGPEYVRKHIHSKHMEKIDEVKKEVEYFNNYLKDPKRPQLPEHPGNTKKESGSPGMFQRQPMPMAYQPYYAPPMMMGRGRGMPRGGGRMDTRPLIHYRDLDAPAGAGDDIF